MELCCSNTHHISPPLTISCGEVTILSFAQCFKRLNKKHLLTKLFYRTNSCDVSVFQCHQCLYTFYVSSWNVTASCLAFTFLFAYCFLRYCPEFLALICAGRCGMWENCSCFPWPSWSHWCRISGNLPSYLYYLVVVVSICDSNIMLSIGEDLLDCGCLLWAHYKDYFPPWIRMSCI